MSSSSLRMGALGVSMLLASLNTSIANAVLPTLAKQLGASFPQAQWIIVAYLLAMTSTVVIAGRLGDLLGRKGVLVGGLLVFAAGSLLCGVASGVLGLIAARAAQGIGAAVMMALSVALATESSAEGASGKALGMLGTMSAAGTAFGPTLGGLLISGIGWRSVFLVSVPLALVAAGVAQRSLPHQSVEPRSSSAQFDFKGAVLLALSLTAYALSMTLERGRFGWGSIALIAVALLGFAAFMRVESKAEHPLVPPKVVQDRDLRVGLVSSLVVSAVMMSTLVVGPYYLSKALHLDPLHIGLALSLGPVVVALVAVPAGRVADQWGSGNMSRVGLGAMLLGASLLTVVHPGLGLAGYLAPIVAMCAGYGVFQTANNTAIMAGATSQERGVVGGVLNLSRNLGLITGASMLAALFGWVSGISRGDVFSTRLVATGMQVTFLVSALLVLGALIAYGQTRRPVVDPTDG